LGRYRDPVGKERTKTHTTKGDALRWAQEQERAMRSLDWTDPARAKITVAEWAPHWRTTLSVKPKTMASYDSLLTSCVLPRWGAMRLDRITAGEVRSWIAGMMGQNGRPLSESRRTQAFLVLRSMLDLAVEDGRLPKNPARPAAGGAKRMLPKLPKSRTHTYLTHEQLHALADRAGEYRTLILVLGYCGLRWGEATALRLSDVDLLHGRLHVRRSVSDVNGALVYGMPKNHATRSVPIPAFLHGDLEALMVGRGPDDPLFASPRGGALYLRNFRYRDFDPAARAAGLTGVTPHVLRHTAASLAIAAGANVKAVQRMLGHASAAMTLDVYSGLFEDDLDGVASRLNEAAAAVRADSVRTGGSIRTLTDLRQGGKDAR